MLDRNSFLKAEIKAAEKRLESKEMAVAVEKEFIKKMMDELSKSIAPPKGGRL